MQIITPSKVYPVIVVGSGASGGMAAWNLTRKGINVLLLDAGTKFERSKFWTHVRPWEARARRAKGEKPPQFFLDTKEQPYLTPEGKPAPVPPVDPQTDDERRRFREAEHRRATRLREREEILAARGHAPE